MRITIAVLTAVFFATSAPLQAEGTAPETWSLHAQATFVDQYHPAFRSAYRGANSLDPGSRGNETLDATLFAGVRLWQGGEVYANPEIDQGFGLSNTLGLAGFSSGEAYKVGKPAPYLRLQRLFFRQTFDLGGDVQTVDAAANQLGGTREADNLVLTAGKISVGDVFDANGYAHDQRQDFLNWAVIDSGAFDYAADAWGYSYGLTAELTEGRWTLRSGLFDLSRVPNSTQLQRGFGQFELVGEIERRSTLFGREGKIKLLGYLNYGRMGRYDDAVQAAKIAGGVPEMASVRRSASKVGYGLNLEQPVSDSLGVFARLSASDGSKEAYEFTEINWSTVAGLSLKGSGWGRTQDTVGLALVVNGLAKSGQRYLAAGGMGILIGDGQLTDYGAEKIVELYYTAPMTDWLFVTGDYQFAANPAYNGARGPVSILALRLHAAL
ncbi:MAG: carbohydrate porin [Rhizomicrobium sp.]|nr:carbohydrate porin [Rhizomicrobium sp.]